ncbi:MAG: hypothetical protein AABY09_03870, partial [Nanoarchaeota archaeon]
MSTLQNYNYIMAAGLAVGLAGGSVDAEARTRKIEDLPVGIELTRERKLELISKEMFGKAYRKLKAMERTGVAWAADRAAVVIDPRCKSNQLVFDDNNVRWGMQWHRRRKERPAERPAASSSSSETNVTNVYTDSRTTHVHNDNRVTKVTNVYQTDEGRLDKHRRRLDKQGREIEGLKNGSTPYTRKSEVSAYGGVFNEWSGGQSFSRGYVAGGNALLRKRFASGKLGQLELKAEGLHTAYTNNSGDATVFDGKLRG